MIICFTITGCNRGNFLIGSSFSIQFFSIWHIFYARFIFLFEICSWLWLANNTRLSWIKTCIVTSLLFLIAWWWFLKLSIFYWRWHRFSINFVFYWFHLRYQISLFNILCFTFFTLFCRTLRSVSFRLFRWCCCCCWFWFLFFLWKTLFEFLKKAHFYFVLKVIN